MSPFRPLIISLHILEILCLVHVNHQTHSGKGIPMVRTFGQKCDEGEGHPCLGSQVICLSSGVCGCSSNEDMTYDPKVEDCVVNLGKMCSFDSDCVKGSRCDLGICRCDAGSYASEGACLPKKVYREPCLTDSECGTQLNSLGEMHQRPLTCLDGNCQCDRKSDTFSEKRETCVGLVGSECIVKNEGEDCTENSECKNPSKSLSVCQCRDGFAKNSYGRCDLSYGSECGSKVAQGKGQCADLNFICVDGKCTCKYPLHQMYDETTKECLSLVSGPCTFPRNVQMNLTGDFQKCVKNAHCVDKGFYSECECKPGFVPTRNGSCAPGYGEHCHSGECDPDNNSQLVCRNGICHCLDLLQVYDPSLKLCRGLVGSRCTIEQPDCVEFAGCVVPDQNLPGKCLCDKYSQEVMNRTCDYRV